jgi:mRNA-degrading endonuclease RelE of RelBE toxin-antitoxin system
MFDRGQFASCGSANNLRVCRKLGIGKPAPNAFGVLFQANHVRVGGLTSFGLGTRENAWEERLMNFRIADTFTDSLAKLTGDEQKSVKTTAFDLQMNPANPGMGFHKLDKARDKCFWSVRVGSDIRLISP